MSESVVSSGFGIFGLLALRARHRLQPRAAGTGSLTGSLLSSRCAFSVLSMQLLHTCALHVPVIITRYSLHLYDSLPLVPSSNNAKKIQGCGGPLFHSPVFLNTSQHKEKNVCTVHRVHFSSEMPSAPSYILNISHKSAQSSLRTAVESIKLRP